jgi:hypothetical protein
VTDRDARAEGGAGAPAQAAVKRAPAKKAPAKKAPAKKAAAKKAAAKKAPAKKAPNAAARTAARKAPAEAPRKAALAAPHPADVAGLEGGLEVPASSDLVPGLRPDSPAPRTRRPWSDRWPRLLLGLTLLLVAAGLAMAVASLVMRGTQTWSAGTTVRLVRVDGASPLPDQLGQLQSRVHLLTAAASQRAAVADEDVRDDLGAAPLGSDQLSLVARAARADEAERLVAAAAAVLTDRADSLGLRVTSTDPVRRAERVRPSLRTALVTGGLAGAGLLLLVGSGYLLRRARTA